MSIHSRLWWVTAVRGTFSLLLGLIALMQPLQTLLAALFIVGTFLCLDGVSALLAVIPLAHHRRLRTALLAKGVLGLLMGVVFFAWPDSSLLVILYFLACWAILTGLLEVIAAVELKLVADYHGWLGVVGGISVLVGLLLFVRPFATLAGFVQIAGFYALFNGVLLLLAAGKIYTRSHPMVF